MNEISLPVRGEPVECGPSCKVGIAQMELVGLGVIPKKVCALLATNHVIHSGKFYLAKSLGFDDVEHLQATVNNNVTIGLTPEQTVLRERFDALISEK